MAKERIFIKGMFFNEPHKNAPDFVKGGLSINVDEFIEFAKNNQNDGKLNIDLLESKSGKYYAALNTYKREDTSTPGGHQAPSSPDDLNDEIPFN